MRKRNAWMLLGAIVLVLVAAAWLGGGWAWDRILEMHGRPRHDPHGQHGR